jgi:anti-anti-sigma factor
VEIEVKTEGEVTILFLKGHMEVGEGDLLLRKKVETLVESEKINIVLDMAGVSVIDSGCLGEILHCHVSVTKKGGTLKLANLSEKLRVLLARTKIAWVHEDLLSDSSKS